MDQRREPRFFANQSVVVTVLGEHEKQFPATIRNTSGRGLALEVPSAIPPGSALQMEVDDSIVLGESVYCRGADHSYLIGVQFDQMLCGLLELRKHLEEFAPPDVSETEVAHAVKHRPRQNC